MNLLEGLWVCSQDRNISGEGVYHPSFLSTSRSFYDIGHGHRAPRSGREGCLVTSSKPDP